MKFGNKFFGAFAPFVFLEKFKYYKTLQNVIMVQNVFNLGEHEDKILGIVKAQHGLKNKSQAIELILRIYGESFLEPELCPEFLKSLARIKKQKGVRFSSVEELREHIEKNA